MNQAANTAGHTPEPWHVTTTNGGKLPQVYSTDGECIASLNQKPISEANARRIVACVNACAGIPTETLEGDRMLVTDATLGAMVKQRDELAAALRQALSAHKGDWQNGSGWEKAARTALAMVPA